LPYIERVARRLLGEPNKALSTRQQLRFGSNGSLAVEIAGPKRGEWYDHENELGGSVRELLLRQGGAADPAGVAEYYVDEAGKLRFQVLRWGPKKTFSQQQPGSGKGGVKRDAEGRPTMQGVQLVPYRLDQLAAAAAQRNGKPWRVYIVEGEKDADRLATQWNLTATTNPGGAGKWRKEFGQYFIGAEVVLIADNDQAGRNHAAAVAAALQPFASVIKLVELSGPK
jgi:hypothetical protein